MNVMPSTFQPSLQRQQSLGYEKKLPIQRVPAPESNSSSSSSSSHRGPYKTTNPNNNNYQQPTKRSVNENSRLPNQHFEQQHKRLWTRESATLSRLFSSLCNLTGDRSFHERFVRITITTPNSNHRHNDQFLFCSKTVCSLSFSVLFVSHLLMLLLVPILLLLFVCFVLLKTFIHSTFNLFRCACGFYFQIEFLIAEFLVVRNATRNFSTSSERYSFSRSFYTLSPYFSQICI